MKIILGVGQVAVVGVIRCCCCCLLLLVSPSLLVQQLFTPGRLLVLTIFVEHPEPKQTPLRRQPSPSPLLPGQLL